MGTETGAEGLYPCGNRTTTMAFGFPLASPPDTRRPFLFTRPVWATYRSLVRRSVTIPDTMPSGSIFWAGSGEKVTPSFERVISTVLFPISPSPHSVVHWAIWSTVWYRAPALTGFPKVAIHGRSTPVAF